MNNKEIYIPQNGFLNIVSPPFHKEYSILPDNRKFFFNHNTNETYNLVQIADENEEIPCLKYIFSHTPITFSNLLYIMKRTKVVHIDIDYWEPKYKLQIDTSLYINIDEENTDNQNPGYKIYDEYGNKIIYWIYKSTIILHQAAIIMKEKNKIIFYEGEAISPFIIKIEGY